METTLLVGDVLFVNKFLFGAKVPFINANLPAVREPRHGDIVVFISPIEDSTLVKRLIGMPGDTLQMRAGVLYRNGKALEEPYAQSLEPDNVLDPGTRSRCAPCTCPKYIGADTANYLPDVHEWGPLLVPRDSLWMMGATIAITRAIPDSGACAKT